jgi:predicted nucleotidyltransferase
MNGPAAFDPVLDRFRSAVAELYGDQLERVVLFGSRARGDFRPDSDYDVAVFVRQLGGFWDEVRRLADVTTDILLDTGAVISAKPFRAESYNDTLPLMGEIRRDGRAL